MLTIAKIMKIDKEGKNKIKKKEDYFAALMF